VQTGGGDAITVMMQLLAELLRDCRERRLQLRRNHCEKTSFLSFPYVHPEPVLVKCSFSVQNWKRDWFLT
jgi:hypothetical protein